MAAAACSTSVVVMSCAIPAKLFEGAGVGTLTMILVLLVSMARGCVGVCALKRSAE